MSDYRRFISYIYAYERDIKSKNVGFAKVEVRNGECRITINIKGAFAASEKELEAYLFYREEQDLPGIYLGRFLVRNGMGEFRCITEAENIGSSGMTLDKMCGIILCHEDEESRMYASGWDDLAVVPQKLISRRGRGEALKEAETEKKTVAEKTIPEEIPVIAAVEEELRRLEISGAERIEAVQAEAEQVKDADIETEPEHISEEPFGAEETAAPDVAVEEDEALEANEADMAVGANEADEALEPHIAVESHIVSEPDRKAASGEWLKPEHLRKPDLREEPVEDSKPVQEQSVCQTIHKDLWERLEDSFPKIVAFEDAPEVECLKIDLKDLEHLPRENWGLANNSFLLHGYYNFRYLILGKMQEDEYMLGVPGMFHNNERFLAAMFGFEYFKPVTECKPLTGHFGYWYRRVILSGKEEIR